MSEGGDLARTPGTASGSWGCPRAAARQAWHRREGASRWLMALCCGCAASRGSRGDPGLGHPHPPRVARSKCPSAEARRTVPS